MVQNRCGTRQNLQFDGPIPTETGNPEFVNPGQTQRKVLDEHLSRSRTKFPSPGRDSRVHATRLKIQPVHKQDWMARRHTPELDIIAK
jgi:hypothetical protein